MAMFSWTRNHADFNIALATPATSLHDAKMYRPCPSFGLHQGRGEGGPAT